MTTVYTPQVGDRVVVESPVFFVGEQIVEHFVRDCPKVGDVFTVQSVEGDLLGLSGSWASHVDAVLPLDRLDAIASERRFPLGTAVVVESDVFLSPFEGLVEDDGGNVGKTGVVELFHSDGDVTIAFDEGGSDTFHPDALLRVDDLDALAVERAPEPVALVIVDNSNTSDPHSFEDGTIVYRVAGREPNWGGRVLVSTDPHSTAVYMVSSGSERAYWVEADDVALDAPAEPETTVGTATVRIDVRFFVGETDVTDYVNAVHAEALAEALAKEVRGE